MRVWAGWCAGKPSIVEQLNEFIQELKHIDSSIAAHVRPCQYETPSPQSALSCVLLSYA